MKSGPARKLTEADKRLLLEYNDNHDSSNGQFTSDGGGGDGPKSGIRFGQPVDVSSPMKVDDHMRRVQLRAKLDMNPGGFSKRDSAELDKLDKTLGPDKLPEPAKQAEPSATDNERQAKLQAFKKADSALHKAKVALRHTNNPAEHAQAKANYQKAHDEYERTYRAALGK